MRARGGRPPAWRREVRRAVGGALNVAAARLLNLGRGRPAAPALELESYLRLRAPAPLDLARLLAGRPNRERARVTEAVLRAAGLPVVRQPYRTLEGAGVNLFVDVGPGPATLVLAAHHDAVPGSPGANDNAASIGILLGLARRLLAAPPRGLRVRFAFFGGEERAMLGSRVHARRAALGELLGVVSLELCGIGDALALWDVTPELADTALVRAWIAVVEGLGYRADETYHLTGPVPFFGSDHRPFVDRGVPGAGLTVVPRAALEPLRAFIYGGVRGILVPPARRPPPFTTYHTAGDTPETLEPAALAAVDAVLDGLVRRLDAAAGPPGGRG
ncbi:MAG TPA: M28 family peptidase [Methylomirabilota bacterium]|nr:M28 family peptidase [Methylomirabilota bacterium]